MGERYLFRGKRTDTGKWEIGLLARYNEKYPCANIIDETELLIPVETKTVGQYTGLKDKNGKLIFEGDLLRFTIDDGEQSIYRVFYNDIYAGWRIGEVNCGCIDEMSYWENYRECFEVIGNIHDNPNLLKIEHDSLCETETYKAGDTE